MRADNQPVNARVASIRNSNDTMKSVGKNQNRQGFTLVEMLIVIAIIAVLSLVSFTVSSRMTATSRAATCMSNLRQMAVAVTAEAGERGAYPPVLSQSTNDKGVVTNNGDDLYSILGRQPYCACPGAKHRGLHPQDKKPITAYGANPMVMGNSQNGNPPLVRPSQISRPAEVILLADGAQFGLPNPRAIGFAAAWWLSRNGNPSNRDKKLTTAQIPASGFWGEEALMPMRHNGKANVVFCDGHARVVSGIGDLKEKNLYWNY